MSSEKTPKLTLVGAGPGDPDLISVKGIKALRTADVILYDALIDPALLEYAGPDTEKIFVGKRADRHAFPQQEINRMIVACAFNYGHVVRLKGGDPFVFGRGQEEKEYAEIFNIPVDVVPGISSVTGIPANLGIPLTMRGWNESFWVMTATGSNGELTNDLRNAVHSDATVVILMGIGKLGQIAALFQEAGKGNLPVAVVQNGTTHTERYAIGTMNDIVEHVRDKGIGTPGIIIAGQVVSTHRELESVLVNVNRLNNGSQE